MNDILNKPMLCGLDPLFSVHVKICAAMLTHMVPGQWRDGGALYFYTFAKNQQPRPIRLVRMAGIVVYLVHHQKFTKFLIDDGTGTAPCMVWTNQPARHLSTTHLVLGAYIELRGRLEWRDGLPILVVQWLQMSNDPHAELIWWMQVKSVHEKVYRQDYKTCLSN